VHFQDDGPANAADVEISCYQEVIRADELAAGAFERDVGVLADIQKIAAAQMVIALLLACP
jgi:hypothetical protein